MPTFPSNSPSPFNEQGIEDREFFSHKENADDQGTDKRVTDYSASGLYAFAPPPETDAIDVSYPNATTEIYRFRTGGLTGTILKTVTVVYTDSTKDFISTVEVT